uniref:Ycf54 n=1 Tax=Sporolithon durum TaxID=48970 RepID=A0A141SD14_9FLOR|nr:hypothetical protein Sdur_136 [Sporolithon durum]AMK96182.1 hypothetical protein Sdur_136 [Sporolithon durum]
MNNYYFVIASQDFLIREEPVEEILRERTNYYRKNNKEVDFWFIKNPEFLYVHNMFHLSSKLKKPSAAIVSLDHKFIDWLNLRIGYVITGSFQSNSIESYNTEIVIKDK